MPTQLDQFLRRAEALLERVEAILPPAAVAPDWQASTAFRWRKRNGIGYLQPVPRPAQIAFDDLQHIARQKAQIEQNTRQFVDGKPANNVLLTGARGTGKSSLIKACLAAFAAQGLRLIEVDKADLHDLPDIMDLVAGRKERFVVFCDDLSFEEGESGYKALKVALDGSVSAVIDNVLIYATSNRRHLMPERMSDNATYKHDEDGDLHPGETVEEKISLSERFGLWLSFYPFKQDDYLGIVAHWLAAFGCTVSQIADARAEALQWALQRGSRSGRVAWQFARDYAGEAAMSDAARPIDVAVGILMQPNGDVLLGQRPEGKPYAGYWEFPGGKVDPGETILEALKREFVEELGIHITSAEEWCGIEHVYPHAHVRLHFFISREWRGEPQSLEGQAFAWQGTVGVEPLLPATIPLLEWLDRVRY